MQYCDAATEDVGVVRAEPLPLTIYFEDELCLVVDKPAGMVVHPSKGQRSGTLVNALLHHVGFEGALEVPDEGPRGGGGLEGSTSEEEGGLGDHLQTAAESVPEGEGPGSIAEGGGAAAPERDGPALVGLSHMVGAADRTVRPGIVHRLDKGTSGVMVVAKSDAAHFHLARQFAERVSQRTYLALLWGVPGLRQGKVTANIGRDPNDRLRMAVVPDDKGKHAGVRPGGWQQGYACGGGQPANSGFHWLERRFGGANSGWDRAVGAP